MIFETFNSISEINQEMIISKNEFIILQIQEYVKDLAMLDRDFRYNNLIKIIFS